MQVAFVTQYTALYGANRSLLCLLDGLRDTEIEPSVVLPAEDDGLHDELRRRNIPTIESIVPLQFATTSRRPSSLHPIRRRRWTATRIQQLGAQTSVAIEKLIPSTKNFRAVYSNTVATHLGHELSKRISIPHIWHLREFPENYGAHFIGGLNSLRRRLKQSSELIAISHAIAKRLVGGNTERCNVIYNGVGFENDFHVLKQRREIREANRRFRFLLLGQILPSKGHDQAIKACEIVQAETSEFELRIVGSGDSAWLEKAVTNSRCVDQIVVAGPTDDPYSEILQADCLLMCSPMEAMGRVTAEAMVAGCPVIGLDAFGTSELIDHNQSGLLYRGGPRRLAREMQRIISEPSLSERLTRQAFSVASKRFSNESYSSKVVDVIRRAVSC